MKKAIYISVSIVILLIAGIFIYYRYWGTDNTLTNTTTNIQATTNQTTINTDSTPTAQWQEGGIAVAGNYADADVVDMGDGQWRMYYSAEPEIANFNGQIYSSISTDGINWSQEDGERLTQATFPDVVKLTDGTWRMYFQKGSDIMSATSPDGLTWTMENSARVDNNETGFTLDNVAAPTVIQLSDDSWIMVYRGVIDEPYSTNVKTPNSNTQLFFFATSVDGINFTKQGLAVDSRNDTLYGLADGPEWVQWTDDTLHLSFWSYSGVYYSVYENGQFSTPIFSWTNNIDSSNKFPPNPPGDPTYAYINDTWFMYYGEHTEGIYYATL